MLREEDTASCWVCFETSCRLLRRSDYQNYISAPLHLVEGMPSNMMDNGCPSSPVSPHACARTAFSPEMWGWAPNIFPARKGSNPQPIPAKQTTSKAVLGSLHLS